MGGRLRIIRPARLLMGGKGGFGGAGDAGSVAARPWRQFSYASAKPTACEFVNMSIKPMRLGDSKRFVNHKNLCSALRTARLGEREKMYGILAACIAVMAMFLALFALSVEPNSKNLQDKLTIETVQTPLAQVSVKE
jgi:hypothetical protein